ncbi:hypothetical protein INT47_000134 [Mucor saturninus]|uniref:Uncharacterized protein n=1 Tax=Mucor saturninus TaxID=64648 RepID=A0A8H7RGG6_9FUNG|nr:hypothetical protein INT47_000134 [Mucor saturninus]
MTDLNWCTYCDSSISQTSNSLYCSEQCLRSDALLRHPSLGYEYPEFKHFFRKSGFIDDKQLSGKLATTDMNNNGRN